jgi:predicted MFS family arabinose efflux permease
MNMRSRNVFLLALCQAIGMCGPSIIVLLSGIISEDIAPNPALATLPSSLGVVSMALTSIPGALLMRRIGRRKGFMFAAGVAAIGAVLATVAVMQHSFALLCLAVFFIGQNNAFVLQYRFAAAESVEPQHSGRAVSLVLLGGILAGYLGPQIGNSAKGLLPTLYAGPFAVLAGLYILAIGILFFLRDVLPPKQAEASSGRPLGEIVRQPNFQVALLAGVASYGLMNFIMTATPLHMHGTGFTLGDTAFVIQSHIIAMYVPSLITGFLVERLGTVRIMTAGALLMAGCTIAGLLSTAFAGYWVALVLLGLGWNLLFVGGTVLLTKTYRPAERFKTQAANDFTIFAMQAVSSFSAGSLLHTTGWDVMNYLGLSLMMVTLAVIFLQRKRINPSPLAPLPVGEGN